MRSIKAKVLIVGNKRDQLIGRDDLAEHARVIPGARFFEVDSPAGHAVCCGIDPGSHQGDRPRNSGFPGNTAIAPGGWRVAAFDNRKGSEEKAMKLGIGVLGSIRIVCSLLLFWTGAAWAGAPAPTPASAGPHPEHQVANLGDFKFENGDVVKDFKVSYVTYGKLNKAKSNAILLMQYFLGDHHMHDFLIGPGKAFDPEKYFIVATDMLGNSGLTQGVTTGATNSGLKMDFPFFSIRDSMNVEYRFLKEYLGIDHVLAVIGASIGAMKSYQFAVTYPSYITAAIPIAGSPLPSQ